MTRQAGVWTRLATSIQQRQQERKRIPRHSPSVPTGRRSHRIEKLEDRRLLSISADVPIGSADTSPGSPIENHGQWLDFDPNDGLHSGAVASIELTSSSHDGITGEITIPGAWLETVTLGDVKFDRITIPGFGYANAIGEPQLPVLRNLLTVPTGAESVTTIGVHSQLSLSDIGIDHPIAPVQTPVPKLKGALESSPLDFNQVAYQTGTFTLDTGIRVSDGGTIAGQDVAMFEVAPFSYNPSANEISVFTSLTFQVDFVGGQWGSSEVSNREDSRLSNLALNYDSAIDRFVKSTERLLIIVHDDFAGELTSFVDHKTSLGWTVDVADTSTAGTTNTAIRSYIQSRYDVLDTRPDAVLLVGDTDRIPHFVGSGAGTPDTDLYYGCMDGGDDWYQEFPVGRFSVDTSTELANVVEKTIWYEASSSGDWTSHAVFMAGDDNYHITEGTHNWVIDNYMDPLEFTSDRLYEVTYGATTQDVRDAFNDGRMLGIYSGHGGDLSWADGPAFSQSDVRNLTNEGMYSLVASFACVTGAYAANDEAFTETWLVAEDSGAVAVVGSSVNSYWDEDDILQKRLFDAIYDEGHVGYGDAWMRAKEMLRDHYGATSTVRRYFEMYNVMGDPTVEVIPLGPDEVGPAIASHSPGTTIDSQSAVTFHFNELMDTGSFDVDDDVVSFSGPSGNLMSEITGFEWTDDRTLEVQFNLQSTIGAYSMVIGPNITDDDPSYNEMDQDGDGVLGEVADDLYTANFEIVPDVDGPAVTGHTPSASANPQSTITFLFNERMDTSSFAVLDDVFSFDGPSGNLKSEISGFTWVDSSTLEVQFSEQSTPGIYSMIIGPEITDDATSFNWMNQDGDAINGEMTDDLYTGTFTIIDALYFADMTTDPNWTLEGSWAWGVPGGMDGDPASGYTDDHVVGFNLGGDYPNNMAPTHATTSAIDCTGYSDISLSFHRWLGVESSSFDHAKVEVSNNGVNWTTVWNHSGGSFTDTTWHHEEFDISAVADDQPTVYVRWTMGATDGSITYCGWNIDDVLIAGAPLGPDMAGPTVVHHTPGSTAAPQSAVTFQFNEPMDTDSFAVVDDVVSFTGPSGDLMSQISGYRWVDDRLLEIQFAEQSRVGTYSMVIGPDITDDGPSYNLMNQDGDAFNGESPGDLCVATFEIIDAIYLADMDVDPNWTLGGNWAWGTPAGNEGDPTSGYTGDNVIGYNLDGDYSHNMSPAFATTPAIDCSGYDDVTFSFQRMLGIESSDYDHAKVEVSNNGTSWTTLWNHSGGSFTDADWVFQEFDISAVADNQSTVYIRWTMGTTDGSVAYCGWNIDDLLVTGVANIAPADFNHDGMTDGDDFLIWQGGFGSFPGGGATHGNGDADGDGDVDGDDFLIWQAGFGSSEEGSAAMVVGESMPGQKVDRPVFERVWEDFGDHGTKTLLHQAIPKRDRLDGDALGRTSHNTTSGGLETLARNAARRNGNSLESHGLQTAMDELFHEGRRFLR